MINIRFVAGNDLVSDLIKLQAGIAMPFTPSHVEAVSQDGKSYIGAHLSGGVQARPLNYYNYTSEKIIPLDVSPDMEKSFYDFVQSRIGMPYDWRAIVGFIATEQNLHARRHAICSAFMTAALRHCGYFPNALAVPFHHISPRDLLLALSSHVRVT